MNGIPKDNQNLIARINEVVNFNRISWVTLVSYLLFMCVTLFGVEDVDFFVPSRKTSLPILNTEVSTYLFFITAPILGVAIYGYFHVSLQKVFMAVMSAPKQIDKQYLSDFIKPSPIIDMILAWRHDDSLRPNKFNNTLVFITKFLAFHGIFLVYLLFLLRSLPAKDIYLSISISTCLIAILLISDLSLRNGKKLISEKINIEKSFPRNDFLMTIISSLSLVIVITLVIYSPNTIRFKFLQADLSGLDLVDRPSNWRAYSDANREFSSAWCQSRNIHSSVCGIFRSTNSIPEETNLLNSYKLQWCKSLPTALGNQDCENLLKVLNKAYMEKWMETRATTLTKLPSPNLEGRNLFGADFENSFLAGINFRQANLSNANLSDSNSEAADFTRANLKKTRFDFSQIQMAYFSGATLEDSTFIQADLESAKAWDALIERSNFSQANLQNAVLFASLIRESDFTYTNLKGVDFSLSILIDSDFRGATGLTQAQLDKAIGNEGTLLPDTMAPDTNQPYYVWSCFKQDTDKPKKLPEDLLIRYCDLGELPQKTGKPSKIDEKRTRYLR